jgi:hypothetical protein
MSASVATIGRAFKADSRIDFTSFINHFRCGLSEVRSLVFGALGGAVAGGIEPEQPFGLVRCGRGTCCFVSQNLREAASGCRVLGAVQDLGHGGDDLNRCGPLLQP